MIVRYIIAFVFLGCGLIANSQAIHIAPAPLYRCPVYDGAADPTVIYNHNEKSWWMLYTQRRANQDGADVSYCYGSNIGVASSSDHGATWVYRGALDLSIEKGQNTFWAPEVVFEKGVYHMYVAYIQGVRNHWGGDKHIMHYSSKDMWDWKFESQLPLSSVSVIDACVFHLPDGKWRMWYKDETQGSVSMTAESPDLYHWTMQQKAAVSDRAHEGPKVFRFKDKYWMVVDQWAGLAVYSSDDCDSWIFNSVILDKGSKRNEDQPSGAHADVIVVNEKAYIFYFTHPGRKTHLDAPNESNDVLPYNLRRSSIQVAELKLTDNKITCDRDEPFDFYLP